MAIEVADAFKAENIFVEIRKPIEQLQLLGQDFEADLITLLVPKEHLKNAISIAEKVEESIDYEIPNDHYLLEFSNAELYDVVNKYDEWSDLDVKWARQILNKRGENIDENTFKAFKEKRFNQLRKPERVDRKELWKMYKQTLLGGVPGIMYGWSIWQSKKRLPNGDMFWFYHDDDRKIGLYLFIAGAVLLILIVIITAIHGKSWLAVLLEAIGLNTF